MRSRLSCRPSKHPESPTRNRIAQPTASRSHRDSASVYDSASDSASVAFRVHLRLCVRYISCPSTTPHPLHYASVYDSASDPAFATFRSDTQRVYRAAGHFEPDYSYLSFVLLLFVSSLSLNKFIIFIIIESLLRPRIDLRTPHKIQPTAFGK